MNVKTEGQQVVWISGEDEMSKRMMMRDMKTGKTTELDVSKLVHPPNDWRGLGMKSWGPDGAEFTTFIEMRLGQCMHVLRIYGHQTIPEFKTLAPGEFDALTYSDVWYGSRIARKCEEVLLARKLSAEMSEPILFLVIEIGELFTEWDWRHRFKAHSVRGDGTLKSAKSGADARRNALAQNTNSVLDQMDRLIKGGHSVQGAATALARKQVGTSSNANRALWNRHRAKKMSHDPPQ